MTRFGMQMPNFAFGTPDVEMFDQLKARAQAAEAAGYDSLWVMDHFWQLPALGGPGEPILEAYTLLGGLAAVTDRIQLGTLVTGVTYRNPALLAKIVTTLDVMSKGRAILGLGAAWYDVEHHGLGFEFPPVKERMDRLEEAVQICRAMFCADGASFQGRHYSIDGARNLPRPIRPNGIPIMIGGGGEQRTLKLVAKYADQCNVTGDVATMRHKIDVLHHHCATVGRDPSEVEITRMSSLFLTTSDDETRQTEEFLRSMTGDDFDRMFDVGTEAQIAEKWQAFKEIGVHELIVSMPFAAPEAVAATAGLLKDVR